MKHLIVDKGKKTKDKKEKPGWECVIDHDV